MQVSINGSNTQKINSNELIPPIQNNIKCYDKKSKEQYPTARWKHAAVIYKNFLYIMGGYTWTNTLKDLWRLNLKGLDNVMSEQLKSVGNWNSIDSIDINHNLWQDLSDFIGGISPLQSHTMVAHDNQLYIFGGAFTYDPKNCPFWIYDIEIEAMRKWKPIEPNLSVPIPRRNHSCCIYNNFMVIFGGFGDVRGSLGDLWVFDFDNEKWHLVWSNQNNLKMTKKSSLTIGPCSRHDHRAVVHRRSLLIFGGMSGLEMCNDLWQWNFENYQWTKLVYKGDHGDLSYLTDVKIDNYWLLFGINDVKKKTEKWMYSFSQNKWTIEPYHIPEFYRFSTLLIFSKNHKDVKGVYHQKPSQNRSKLNKVYPISNESFELSDDINYPAIGLQPYFVNNIDINTKPSEHYQRLDSFFTISKETIFTDLSGSTNCETTFINSSNGEEVPIESYKRELLIILGNNIEKASFDYHLNVQLLYV